MRWVVVVEVSVFRWVLTGQPQPALAASRICSAVMLLLALSVAASAAAGCGGVGAAATGARVAAMAAWMAGSTGAMLGVREASDGCDGICSMARRAALVWMERARLACFGMLAMHDSD